MWRSAPGPHGLHGGGPFGGHGGSMPDPVQTGAVTTPAADARGGWGATSTLDVGRRRASPCCCRWRRPSSGSAWSRRRSRSSTRASRSDAVVSTVDGAARGSHPGGDRARRAAPHRLRRRGAAGGWSSTIPRGPADAIDPDAHTYLRQSRYCPSDQVLGFALAELRDVPAAPSGATAIADWVFERLAYEVGSSGPLDTAIDTLLRARGLPGLRPPHHRPVPGPRDPGPTRGRVRPGLTPMDFHAVAEVRVDGALAGARRHPAGPPRRPSCASRPAATPPTPPSSAPSHGEAELLTSSVTAVSEGDLPTDDHQARMRLL